MQIIGSVHVSGNSDEASAVDVRLARRRSTGILQQFVLIGDLQKVSARGSAVRPYNLDSNTPFPVWFWQSQICVRESFERSKVNASRVLPIRRSGVIVSRKGI